MVELSEPKMQQNTEANLDKEEDEKMSTMPPAGIKRFQEAKKDESPENSDQDIVDEQPEVIAGQHLPEDQRCMKKFVYRLSFDRNPRTQKPYGKTVQPALS